MVVKKNKKILKAKAQVLTSQPNVKFRNTGYSETGASFKKGSLATYFPTRSSPTSDIDVNLPTLRGRSSDLAMGTPVATSAINTSRTNIIGAGLKLSPRPKHKLLGLTAAEGAAWANKTKEEFDLWANSKFCDIFKKNNFYEMQDIAQTCFLIDGDSFALIKYRNPLPGMPYQLRIQIVEGSRVCNPTPQNVYGPINPWAVIMNSPENPLNRIVNGVEIDPDGTVVAYWVANRYPYDPTRMGEIPKWQRVEAFGKQTGYPNILQISHDDRPEQYRGVPYLAPVIETVKQISRYTEAELTSAIIKSFFSLFVTAEQGSVGAGILPLTEPYDDKDKLTMDPNAFELGPGNINTLPPGYDVKSMDPGRSLSTFEPFMHELIKQVGASLEIPYEVLTKSFTASYTAARAALLQAWAAFKMRRTWFSRDFCQPVYEAWLTEAVSRGRIDAPGFFSDPLIRKAWYSAEWYGPVMGVLDPVKEAQGAALKVQYGFSTHEKETAEMTGTDWSDNIERLAVENKTMQELGIPIKSAIASKTESAKVDEDTDTDLETKKATEGGKK